MHTRLLKTPTLTNISTGLRKLNTGILELLFLQRLLGTWAFEPEPVFGFRIEFAPPLAPFSHVHICSEEWKVGKIWRLKSRYSCVKKKVIGKVPSDKKVLDELRLTLKITTFFLDKDITCSWATLHQRKEDWFAIYMFKKHSQSSRILSGWGVGTVVSSGLKECNNSFAPLECLFSQIRSEWP